MDTVQTTVNSYWGLVAARDRVRVAQKSLETARALLDQTRTQYEVGVVSQVEVVEAEAGVANREFELIRTANEYRNAQDSLIDAVLGRELEARRRTCRSCRRRISPRYELEPDRRRGDVAQAFANRPELQDRGERDRAGRGRSQVREEPAAAPARRRRSATATSASRATSTQLELPFGHAAAGSAAPRTRLQRFVRRLLPGRRRGQLSGPGRLLGSDPEYDGSRRTCRAREFELRAAEVAAAFASSRASSSRSAPRAGRCSPRPRASRPPSAGASPPRSSCAPSASGSSTVSRRPSRSCSARTTSSRPRARRSTPCRPSGPRRRRSSAREGTILEAHAIEVDATRKPVR